MIVPAVDPNDLRKAWELFPELAAQRCGGERTVDVLSRLLPNADIEALLQHIAVLKHRTAAGERIDFDEAAKEINL